ncbi:MAG: hypothetical protein EXS35_08710 [Pedosphaera sp.]|nr:hypothetical protein [Pedosphaera sp.]
MRVTILLLLTMMAAGCCTKTVVNRPFGEVRAALLQLEHRITSQKQAFSDAEATGRDISPGYRYELYICEKVAKPFWPYTRLTAKASATNSTSIEVSSRQMGLFINARRPETEQQRLQELLKILQ